MQRNNSLLALTHYHWLLQVVFVCPISDLPPTSSVSPSATRLPAMGAATSCTMSLASHTETSTVSTTPAPTTAASSSSSSSAVFGVTSQPQTTAPLVTSTSTTAAPCTVSTTSSIMKKVHVTHHMDKSSSPRLMLKFQPLKDMKRSAAMSGLGGTIGESPKRARTDLTGQYRSYSVTLGTTPPRDEYDTPISPAESSTSQDSDLYDPHQETTTYGSKRRTFLSQTTVSSSSVVAGSVGTDNVDTAMTSSSHSKPSPRSGSGVPADSSQADTVEPSTADTAEGREAEGVVPTTTTTTNIPTVTSTSQPVSSQSSTVVSSAATSSVSSSPSKAAVTSSSDGTERRGSISGAPSSSVVPVSTGSVSPPTASQPSVSPTPGTGGVSEGEGPAQAGDTAVTADSGCHLSPTRGDSEKSPRQDRDLSKSPKSSSSPPAPQPSTSSPTTASHTSPRPDRDSTDSRDSPKSDKDSRPASPKVPPLKIIINPKSSAPASSSTGSGSQGVKVGPYVLNPTQEQCEGGILSDTTGLLQPDPISSTDPQPPATLPPTTQPSHHSSRASSIVSELDVADPKPGTDGDAVSSSTAGEVVLGRRGRRRGSGDVPGVEPVQSPGPSERERGSLAEFFLEDKESTNDSTTSSLTRGGDGDKEKRTEDGQIERRVTRSAFRSQQNNKEKDTGNGEWTDTELRI